MNPLIILAGPTASGKSETALALAEHFRSEIISADSMQVYRGFDIGTAKPSAEIRRRVPHHLIDILDPGEAFTAFDFKTRAQVLVRDLRARNKTPIMVGGTGLYLKTFIENYECAVEPDPAIRQQVKRELAERGAAALHEELRHVDPAYADQINANDPVRIERALTVYRQSGRPLSDFHRTETASADPYEFDIHLFLLERQRPDLYDHINRRVDGMIESGLKEEVQALLAKGYSKEWKPFQSIGYAQMVRHLEGDITLERARYEIQRETRHFAKRQITWFKKMDETRTVPVEPEDTVPSIMDKILRLLSKTAALFILLWMTGAPASAAADASDPFRKAVEFVQHGQWDAALNTLRPLEQSKLEGDRRKRVTYLLARVLAHKQEHKQAARFFEKSRTLYPEIEDYVRLHLARSQIALGRYPKALAELDRLAARFPRSLLLPRVHLLKADIHRLTGQPSAAVHHLETAYRLIRSRFRTEEYVERLPDILEQQIALYEQIDDAQGQYDAWRKLYIRHPDHPKAQEAGAALNRLAGQAGVKTRPVSLKERARRLRGLLNQARFQIIIDEIQKLLEPEGTVLPGRFYFLLADAHHGLRDRAAANRALEEFMRRHPEHPHVPKAKFIMGRNLWNLDDREGARGRFQEVVDTARRRDLKTEAQFILGKIYEEAKNETAALNEYRALADRHPQTEFGQEAGWQIGWVHYKAKRWPEAERQFRASLEQWSQGDRADKNAFWLAKALEQQDRNEEARTVYDDLSRKFPYTYYGLQAGNKLNGRARAHMLTRPFDTALHKTGLSDAETLPDPPGRTLNRSERFHFVRGAELIELGFYKVAREELRTLAGSIRKTYDGVMWLSGWLNRARAYADSLRLLELYRNFKTRVGEKDLPPEFWKHFYPPAYLTSVQKWSEEYRADPLLAVSLMRQESLYDTWSVSSAGARGLMQLMPQTARRMHRKNGGNGDDFDTELLFDPDFNIRLGVRYLSGLINKYGGNRIHILIAYNAGPHVLKAWLRRFRAIDDPDVFIESIPYPETRKYIKRVSRNYEIYKRLYGNGSEVETANKTF